METVDPGMVTQPKDINLHPPSKLRELSTLCGQQSSINSISETLYEISDD